MVRIDKIRPLVDETIPERIKRRRSVFILDRLSRRDEILYKLAKGVAMIK